MAFSYPSSNFPKAIPTYFIRNLDVNLLQPQDFTNNEKDYLTCPPNLCTT